LQKFGKSENSSSFQKNEFVLTNLLKNEAVLEAIRPSSNVHSNAIIYKGKQLIAKREISNISKEDSKVMWQMQLHRFNRYCWVIIPFIMVHRSKGKTYFLFDLWPFKTFNQGPVKDRIFWTFRFREFRNSSFF